MVNTFTNMTHIVNEQMGNMNTAKMMEQMQLFNEKMGEALINDEMMQE